LGVIGTDSAVEALKKIALWEGHERLTPSMNKDQYASYSNTRYSAVEALWRLRGDQENSFICSLKNDPDISAASKRFCTNNSQ
jgi:hypothetical protein